MPLFDPSIFDTAIFDCSSVGVTERTEFDWVLARLEALPDGSWWLAGMWEPGIFDYCTEFVKVLKKLETM